MNSHLPKWGGLVWHSAAVGYKDKLEAAECQSIMTRNISNNTIHLTRPAEEEYQE